MTVRVGQGDRVEYRGKIGIVTQGPKYRRPTFKPGDSRTEYDGRAWVRWDDGSRQVIEAARLNVLEQKGT